LPPRFVFVAFALRFSLFMSECGTLAWMTERADYFRELSDGGHENTIRQRGQEAG
jgi:hypothetical protein